MTNPNAEPLTARIVDAKLGIDTTQTIAANSVYEQVTNASVDVGASGVFENTVNVTANTLSGASCSASDSVLVKRIEPVIPVSCNDIKDITAVSLIWDGTEPVDIVMESGETFLNVLPGNRITFQEANTGNDVEMTIYAAGTSTVIGMSEFHVSCSDDAMDGTDDCGKNQGNGKDDDAGLVNDWLLDGMTGEKGSFACGLPNTGVVDPAPLAVIAAPTLDLSDKKKVKWELSNPTASDVLITEVSITWPAAHQKLKKMKLDGDFAKDINDTRSPTNVPADKAFESDPNKRTLESGETRRLEIEFDKDVSGRTGAEFTIEVKFSNGDVVKWNLP